MDDRVAYRTIVGARASDGRSVAFINVSIQAWVAVRSRRAFVREVVNERDKGSRRYASNERVDFFGGNSRFALYVSRFCPLSCRCGQAFNVVCRFNNFLREVFVNVERQGVAACGVRLHQLMFYLYVLYVFNRIRCCQAKAATANGVRYAYRHPDCVFYATGLVAPFDSELNSACRISFLGDIYSRGAHPCLSNGGCSEYAICRYVNGANSYVHYSKATYRRAGACLAQCTNGALHYVDDSLFITGRSVIRYVLVVMRDVRCQRSEASKVARSDDRSLVFRKARRYFHAYCWIFARSLFVLGVGVDQ